MVDIPFSYPCLIYLAMVGWLYPCFCCTSCNSPGELWQQQRIMNSCRSGGCFWSNKQWKPKLLSWGTGFSFVLCLQKVINDVQWMVNETEERATITGQWWVQHTLHMQHMHSMHSSGCIVQLRSLCRNCIYQSYLPVDRCSWAVEPKHGILFFDCSPSYCQWLEKGVLNSFASCPSRPRPSWNSSNSNKRRWHRHEHMQWLAWSWERLWSWVRSVSSSEVSQTLYTGLHYVYDCTWLVMYIYIVILYYESLLNFQSTSQFHGSTHCEVSRRAIPWVDHPVNSVIPWALDSTRAWGSMAV